MRRIQKVEEVVINKTLANELHIGHIKDKLDKSLNKSSNKESERDLAASDDSDESVSSEQGRSESTTSPSKPLSVNTFLENLNTTVIET